MRDTHDNIDMRETGSEPVSRKLGEVEGQIKEQVKSEKADHESCHLVESKKVHQVGVMYGPNQK